MQGKKIWICLRVNGSAKNIHYRMIVIAAGIVMNIQEDGSFRMSDVEAGNPVISGDLEFLSDKDLVLKCNTEDDFDPPPTWKTMKEEQKVTYSFTEDGKLHMTYQDGAGESTLVFVKQ